MILEAMTESELVTAHRNAGPEPEQESRPCACGGVVWADPLEPGDGVRDHQITIRHQMWRDWVES